jgi:hypothetical protein
VVDRLPGGRRRLRIGGKKRREKEEKSRVGIRLFSLDVLHLPLDDQIGGCVDRKKKAIKYSIESVIDFNDSI